MILPTLWQRSPYGRSGTRESWLTEEFTEVGREEIPDRGEDAYRFFDEPGEGEYIALSSEGE